MIQIDNFQVHLKIYLKTLDDLLIIIEPFRYMYFFRGYGEFQSIQCLFLEECHAYNQGPLNWVILMIVDK